VLTLRLGRLLVWLDDGTLSAWLPGTVAAAAGAGTPAAGQRRGRVGIL